jgi:hypothetical protein
MAITRTAMIDDDGSGTTGTILNNAWKQELYGQIDGFVGPWIDVPFNAGDFTVVGTGGWTLPGGSITTYASARIGNVLLVALYLTSTTITGAVNYVQVRIPGGLTQALRPGTPFSFIGGAPAVAGTGYGLVEGGQIKIIRDMLATAWPPGLFSFNGVFPIAL